MKKLEWLLIKKSLLADENLNITEEIITFKKKIKIN